MLLHDYTYLAGLYKEAYLSLKFCRLFDHTRKCERVGGDCMVCDESLIVNVTFGDVLISFMHQMVSSHFM